MIAAAPAALPFAAMGATSWDDVCEAVLGEPGVREGRMFGSDCLKVGSKVFASDWRTGIVFKVPAARVQELAAAGGAEPFDPGMGRRMREWVHVEDGAHDWLALAREALAFVREGEAR